MPHRKKSQLQWTQCKVIYCQENFHFFPRLLDTTDQVQGAQSGKRSEAMRLIAKYMKARAADENANSMRRI